MLKLSDKLFNKTIILFFFFFQICYINSQKGDIIFLLIAIFINDYNII